MKKALVLLAVLVVFSFQGISEAEEVLQINEVGEVKTIEQEEGLRSLTKSETKAFNNPGQEVPTGPRVIILHKLDFWHVVPMATYGQVVVFSDGAIQTISKDIIVDGQQSVFALYIVFFLVAIGCMIISNIIKWRSKDGGDSSVFVVFATAVAFTFAVVGCYFAVANAFIANAFVPIAVAAFVAAFAIAFATAVANAFAFAVDNNLNSKAYWIASLVFYICAAVAIFI